MGNNTLIMVLGLMFIFGIVSINMNKSNNASTGTTMGYLKYSQARNLAQTAINLALRRRDQNISLPDSLSGKSFGGSFYFHTKDTLIGGKGYLRVLSTSVATDTSYKIYAVLEKTAKDFPTVAAALGFNFSPVNFSVNNVNKVKISGEDHTWGWKNVNTPFAIDLPGMTTDVPALSVLSVSDSTTIHNSSGSSLYSTVQKITVAGRINNFSEIVREFIAMADVKFDNSNMPNNFSITPPAWGDSGKPKIVYIDATGSTARLNKVTGYGILVIKGNIEIQSNLNWFGLVIPYNGQVSDSTFIKADSVSVTQNGTMDIYGALLMEGAPGSNFRISGTANIYYSSLAIRNAQQIGRLQYYKIVSWYE